MQKVEGCKSWRIQYFYFKKSSEIVSARFIEIDLKFYIIK